MLGKERKYKFYKIYFYLWLLFTVALLTILTINYYDYKEYSVECNSVKCYTNKTFIDQYYILESNIPLDREKQFSLNDEYYLYSGDRLVLSNYKTTPHLIKNFIPLTISTLILVFTFNHISNIAKKNDKNKGTSSN